MVGAVCILWKLWTEALHFGRFWLNSWTGKFASSLFDEHQVHSPHDSVAAATGSQLRPSSTLRFECVLAALSSLTEVFLIAKSLQSRVHLARTPKHVPLSSGAFHGLFVLYIPSQARFWARAARAFRAQDDKVMQHPDTLRFRWEQLEFSEIPAKVSEGEPWQSAERNRDTTVENGVRTRSLLEHAWCIWHGQTCSWNLFPFFCSLLLSSLLSVYTISSRWPAGAPEIPRVYGHYKQWLSFRDHLLVSAKLDALSGDFCGSCKIPVIVGILYIWYHLVTIMWSHHSVKAWTASAKATWQRNEQHSF